MVKLYFATGNPHKLKEATSILGDVEGLDIDLPEIQQIDPKMIIEAKISEAAKVRNDNVFTEDVSFGLECINGLPGPLIKWFLKGLGRDGIVELCRKYDNFNAQAKATIGLYHKGKTEFFEGVINGKIVSPRGESGFGFDPIFQPDGYEKTFAEMPKEEKNAISHRRRALEKMREYLKKDVIK